MFNNCFNDLVMKIKVKKKEEYCISIIEEVRSSSIFLSYLLAVFGDAA